MRNFDAETMEVGHNVKTTSLFLKRKIKSNHLNEWVNKTQHEYLKYSRKDAPDIGNLKTEAWLKNAPFSSPVEGFIFAIQEEEIYTNHLASKRDTENNKTTKCRPICNPRN